MNCITMKISNIIPTAYIVFFFNVAFILTNKIVNFYDVKVQNWFVKLFVNH